jgi:hypothetical protein
MRILTVPDDPTRRSGCHCGPQRSCQGCCAVLAMGGTQQSNRDKESQRRRRTGGVVAGGCEVDTPANKRRCRNKRHGEEEEVSDAMATTEDDALGLETVAAGWEDEDNETG